MFWKTWHPPEGYVIIDGVTYSWYGWLGCQLRSYEWRRVPAGTTRTLKFVDEWVTMTVFSTERKGLKIETKWALSDCGTFDEHTERIRLLQKLIRNCF